MKDNHARKVFPCFASSRIRTTFEISIARKTSMNAVSNMPISGSTSMYVLM